MNAFRSHCFKENLITIQNLRENCGGYGFLQYSGVPAVQENALLNANLENNQPDYLANLALISLRKFGTKENVPLLFFSSAYFDWKCDKFMGFYFPLLYKTLDFAYKEIESIPNKNLDNFVYLARLFNIKSVFSSFWYFNDFGSDVQFSEPSLRKNSLMLMSLM